MLKRFSRIPMPKRIVLNFALGLLLVGLVAGKLMFGGSGSMADIAKDLGEKRNLAGILKSTPWQFEEIGSIQKIQQYAARRSSKFGENAALGEFGNVYMENIPGSMRVIEKKMHYAFRILKAVYVGQYKTRAQFIVAGQSVNHNGLPFLMVIDEVGQEVWRYVHQAGGVINGLDAKDVDGDGVPEFIAAFSGGRDNKILMFDRFGNLGWRLPVEDGFGVKITENYGQPDIIVHATFKEKGEDLPVAKLVTLDKSGQVLRTIRTEYNYRTGMDFTQWPGPEGEDVLVTGPELGVMLASGGERLHIRDLDGNVLQSLPAPGLKTYQGLRAVSFAKNKDTYYFAVLAFIPQWSRTMLFIYSERQDLVYQEVLEAECASIARLRRPQKGQDLLYVGCFNKAYQYSVL